MTNKEIKAQIEQRKKAEPMFAMFLWEFEVYQAEKWYPMYRDLRTLDGDTHSAAVETVRGEMQMANR